MGDVNELKSKILKLEYLRSYFFMHNDKQKYDEANSLLKKLKKKYRKLTGEIVKQ